MINNEKKICIIGAGGFGRETLISVIDAINATKLKIEDVACFMVEDEYIDKNKIKYYYSKCINFS